ALPGARYRPRHSRLDRRAAREAGDALARPLRPDPGRLRAWIGAGADPGGDDDRPLVPAGPARPRDGGGRYRWAAADLPLGGYLRGGVRGPNAVLLLRA